MGVEANTIYINDLICEILRDKIRDKKQFQSEMWSIAFGNYSVCIYDIIGSDGQKCRLHTIFVYRPQKMMSWIFISYDMWCTAWANETHLNNNEHWSSQCLNYPVEEVDGSFVAISCSFFTHIFVTSASLIGPNHEHFAYKLKPLTTDRKNRFAHFLSFESFIRN